MPMRPDRSIVILNAHYTGLGIARSLYGLPVEVYALTAEAGSPGAASRLLKLVHCPDTNDEPQAAVSFLRQLRARLRGPALLVPTRDHDAHFLSRQRADLEPLYDLAIADDAVLQRVVDKQQLFDVARAIGIRCPSSVEISDRSALERAVAVATFPVVAKPAVSRDWRRPEVRRLVQKNKAFVFHQAAQVLELYDRLSLLSPRLLLQEFVPGGDDQLEVFGSCIGRDLEPLAWFTARKLLQYPSGCGNGVVIRAETLPPDVATASLALLRTLGYVGVSELEFKRHPATGELYLIEMNARHWDQHRLSDAVGASVTRTMYEDWIGTPPRSVRRQTRKATLLVEDAWLRGIASSLRTGDTNVRDFLRVLSLPLCGALWDIRDPVPFLHMLRQLAIGAARST